MDRWWRRVVVQLTARGSDLPNSEVMLRNFPSCVGSAPVKAFSSKTSPLVSFKSLPNSVGTVPVREFASMLIPPISFVSLPNSVGKVPVRAFSPLLVATSSTRLPNSVGIEPVRSSVRRRWVNWGEGWLRLGPLGKNKAKDNYRTR